MEGERKRGSGKRSQKSNPRNSSKFESYHPPAKKFERPTQGKKIIIARKDGSIVACSKDDSKLT